jgi:hypothetical protein
MAHKAIFIDVVKQEVSEISMSDNWQDIAPQIGNGCRLFCCPVTFDNNDSLFADDEAILHDEMVGGFYLEGFRIPILNNALIMGADEEGDTTDCKTTVESIKSQIRFVTREDAEVYRDKAIDMPPIIFSF